MTREIVREQGLYKNGNRWWVRSVRSPITGDVAPRSTGTSDVRVANRIAGMLLELRDNRTQWEWLDLAARGEISLDRLHYHFAAGTLHTLRESREAEVRSANDPALTAFVDEWSKHLATVQLEEKTRAEYIRHVRFLTEGLKRSTFTDERIRDRLHSLTVSNSTKRRAVAPLKLFYKWARKRIPLTTNPFEDADWIPANNPPRTTFWEYERVVGVLGKMTGLERVAMVEVFGSGIELGALLAQQGLHINWRSDERTMTAPGSKNEHRMDRTVFVDAWAWKDVRDHARTVLPMAPLWPWKDGGKHLRESFYEAQVAAGLLEAPPTQPKTGKKLWGRVKPHTIHDARHSYVLNRLLGLDGEPRQDMKFCAAQLGHADEQMVMKVYSKANVRERLRLIELRRAREAVGA